MIAMKWLRRNDYFGMINFWPTSEMITWKLLLGNDYLENNYFEMITKKWLLLAYYIQNDYLGTDYLKW